ncbi:MAG: thiamine pyrophosphate-binding protein [Methylophilaceae bacterium]|nr:thiamine pyrophosphate-binding protein [Methylophilaceae bacterium]
MHLSIKKEKKVRVADFIIEYLRKIGINYIFLVPGGGAMFLNDAVAKCKNMKFIANQNEQASTICAEAFSRINEELGVAMVTTGPGSTNAITGVAGAWIESVPLLVISGQVKREDLKLDSGVRQKGPQEVDITSIVQSITKYAKTIQKPTDIKYELEKAIFLAKDGRKGPVWLDVPLDIQATVVNSNIIRGFKTKEVKGSKNILKYEKILKLIYEAKRPLFLIGHGVRLSGAEKEFKKLIKLLKIPTVFTWNALDLMEHKNKLNIGRPGTVALRAGNFAVQNCDLIISIGARLDNVVTAYNPKNFARYAKKIIVDIDAAELKKFTHKVDFKIQSDAKSFIYQLLKKVDKKKLANYSEWIKKCNSWKSKYCLNDGVPFPKKGIISHFQLVDKLSDAIPENSLVVTGSSGLAVESFYTAFRNKKNQRIFLTSGLGSMGYGIPALIGSSAATKKKNIFAIESDGSLMMNIQELATLKSLDRIVKIIIMNNNGYASIRNTQNNYFKGRSIATDSSSQLNIPPIKDLAKAFNIKSIQINRIEELEKKLKLIVDFKESIICEVMLKKDDILWPKSAAIPQKNGSMISMPLEDMSPLLSREELKQQMIYPLSKESMKIKN